MAAAIGGLAVALAIGASDIARPGYSPDEEFTLFAVRGIQAAGVPLLPSGLLYDRGLLYSYAAWAVGAFSGDALWGGRIVSVASAAATLVLVAHGLRQTGGLAAGVLAAALVATSLPFWVSATTARFYAPFLLGYLACLSLMVRAPHSWRRLVTLALLAGLTRWTHELAFTLAGVPLVALVLASSERRGTWLRACVAVVAGLVVSQLAIFAVHAAAPPTNGDVMVKRFFLWQVLNLFERPPGDLVGLLPAAAATGAVTAGALAVARIREDAVSGLVLLAGGLGAALGQLGLGPFAAIVLLPIAPAAWRPRLIKTSLSVLVAGSVFWWLAMVVAGTAPTAAVTRILATGLTYPLDMFTHLIRESPWLVAVTLVGLTARAAGRGGAWPPHERALHALWLGWVAWFGVIESGITTRYLLLPVTFMLGAASVDASALMRTWGSRRRTTATGVCALLGLAVVLESWLGPLGLERRWLAARPTLVTSAAVDALLPDDLVASHDELGCVVAAGRIDAWLVLDEFFRERFVVQRSGLPTGTYTGAPAAPTLLPLAERAHREERRLIVIDVLRDVPGFGPTDGLLPRQLARERLRADVLVELPGVRVVQVRHAPEDAVTERRTISPAHRSPSS